MNDQRDYVEESANESNAYREGMAELQFVATVNVPGYLPMDDEPAVFDTPQQAWSYLTDERERDEDSADDGQPYSDTRETLASLDDEEPWKLPYRELMLWLVSNGLDKHGCGTVYGGRPGYDGDHDLGLAYSVDIYQPEG